MMYEDVTMRFYVSPQGDDAWSGTFAQPEAHDGPLRSLARARDVVRDYIAHGMGGSIEVLVSGATYTLSTPLLFDERDSGRDGCRVTYRNLRNEIPVIVCDGAAGIIIKGAESGEPVQHLQVEGFDLRGAGDVLIAIEHAAHVTIYACQLHGGAQTGIRLHGSTQDVTLSGNWLHGLTAQGIALTEAGADNTVQNNHIHDCPVGIVVAQAGANRVVYNRVRLTQTASIALEAGQSLVELNDCDTPVVDKTGSSLVRDNRVRSAGAGHHMVDAGLQTSFPFDDPSDALAVLFLATDRAGYAGAVTLSAGDEAQLGLTGRTVTGYVASLVQARIGFMSSDEQVVRVNEFGQVLAVNSGEARITASVLKGTVHHSVDLTVQVE